MKKIMKSIFALLLGVMVLLFAVSCDFLDRDSQEISNESIADSTVSTSDSEKTVGTEDSSSEPAADTLYPEDGPDWSNTY